MSFGQRRSIILKLVNVARSKAFALSSEPQVGEALMPEINATSQQIDALLQKLASVLASSEDREILARMTQANTVFTKARQELTAARDGGVTATIEKVYTERFTPAATAVIFLELTGYPLPVSSDKCFELVLRLFCRVNPAVDTRELLVHRVSLELSSLCGRERRAEDEFLCRRE
jgi:hypothetical protein